MEVPVYRTESVVINIPPDEDKLAVSFKLCETCCNLFPEDELTTDMETGHGRCDACWQRVGRTDEELSPEEIAA